MRNKAMAWLRAPYHYGWIWRYFVWFGWTYLWWVYWPYSEDEGPLYEIRLWPPSLHRGAKP